MLRSLFTEHPASVDETYGEHMAMATRFGCRMLLGSLACFVHALLPFLFVRTGSQIIGELHDRMVTNRNRKTATADGSGRLRAYP
jgi:hypothetical protein